MLLVDDFSILVDCVLLVDVDQGNESIRDFKECIMWDDQGVSLLNIICQVIFDEWSIALCSTMVTKYQALLNDILLKVGQEFFQGEMNPCR